MGIPSPVICGASDKPTRPARFRPPDRRARLGRRNAAHPPPPSDRTPAAAKPARIASRATACARAIPAGDTKAPDNRPRQSRLTHSSVHKYPRRRLLCQPKAWSHRKNRTWDAWRSNGHRIRHKPGRVPRPVVLIEAVCVQSDSDQKPTVLNTTRTGNINVTQSWGDATRQTG